MPATKRRIDPVKLFYEFTVMGSRDFPFDMLRYDQCWPKSEGEPIAPHFMGETFKGLRKVTLVGLREPTEGRWKSFGWKVT